MVIKKVFMLEETGIYIPRDMLLRKYPFAECCDCGAQVDDYSGKHKWIIYHKNIIYCPKCAYHEGWDYVEE